MRRSITPLLTILIAIGTLAGLFAAYKRFTVEQHNRRVELTLDFTEVKTLAQISGQPLDTVLARFKRAGASSIAVTEDTFTTLEQGGVLHSQDRADPVSITVASPELVDRLKRALADRGQRITDDPVDRASTIFEAATPDEGEEAPDTERPPGFAVHADWTTLRNLGLGLDPAAVEVCRKAGFDVVGRIGNFPGASLATMQSTLAEFKELGVRTVVFQGLEVLGYRGQYKDAAEALKANGLRFGQVEFGKQKGDESLGAILKGDYVRVHSISEGEMGLLDENEAIDRFVRAARERNIRICYIRLLTLVGADPVSANVEYVSAISRGISRGGEMGFGVARDYPETGVPLWVFGLIGLGVGAGLVLLLLSVLPMRDGGAILALAVAALGCAAMSVALGETGRKLVALLAALVYPTLACLRREILDPAASHRAPTAGTKEAIPGAIRGIISASAVTSLGIVSVVGLLATRPFMLKANQFLGIKAAHAIPLVLIALAAVAGLPKLDRPWASERAALKARIQAFFSEPMRVGTLLAALIGLVVLALIVARTGNEPGVGVSGMELKFRAILDKVLPVRPRTKEFLVGHPAFILALALWYRGRRKWVVPIFLVGVIGQVSILNTFCHAHTPLWLSFVRDITGIIFGTVIGLAIFLLVERLSPLPKRGEGSGATVAAPDA